MKLLSVSIIIITCAFTLSVKAETLSSCQSSCFAAKQSCNSDKSHTFNNCAHDLFSCKASCRSGKPQKVYGNYRLNIGFHPILRLN